MSASAQSPEQRAKSRKAGVGPVVESERIRRFREWCIAVVREAAETEEKQDKGAA